MDQLSELRHVIAQRAFYDAVDEGNLINTAKYEALSTAVWHAFVPEKDKANNRLRTAVSILVSARLIQESWRSHGCLVLQGLCSDNEERNRFHKILHSKEEIDRYAAEGSCPASRLSVHVAARDGRDTLCRQCGLHCRTLPSDISVTRTSIGSWTQRPCLRFGL